MMDNDDLNMTDMCEILATINRYKEEHGEDPNYSQIWLHTEHYFRIDEIIAYLHIACKMGYVEKYGGTCFNHPNKSEMWYFIRYPNSIELIRGDFDL